jgi:hypothetical protein
MTIYSGAFSIFCGQRLGNRKRRVRSRSRRQPNTFLAGRHEATSSPASSQMACTSQKLSSASFTPPPIHAAFSMSRMPWPAPAHHPGPPPSAHSNSKSGPTVSSDNPGKRTSPVPRYARSTESSAPLACSAQSGPSVGIGSPSYRRPGWGGRRIIWRSADRPTSACSTYRRKLRDLLPST